MHNHPPPRLSVCAIAISLGTLMSVSTSADFAIARGGQPVAIIVLPEETELDRYVNATPEEVEAQTRARFPNASPEQLAGVLKAIPKLREKEAKRVGDEEELAVDELVEYIRKVSGAELPVKRLSDGEALPEGNLVLVGTQLARKAGYGRQIDSLDPEGLLLKSTDDRLVLAGRNARGTLYAAYELLEILGCRWIMPGPFGEIYDQRKTLTVSVDKAENPSHRERYWWCTFERGKEFDRWSLRNKGDMVRALGEPRVQQGHALRQALDWAARNTDRGITVRKLVRDWQRDEKGRVVRDENGKGIRAMVEKDVPQLPDEYYAIHNNEVKTLIPNMGNPKVWDVYSEYYRDYFYKRPLEDYASISAEDGVVEDDRPESRALDSYEMDQFLGAFSATDRLWFFHNRYLDRVLEEHPGRKFGGLVYSNNMTPPRQTTVHHAMALIFAPLTICPLHHVRDDKCKTNRDYGHWFEAWMAQVRAVGAEAYYYDYLPIGYQWCNFILSPQWAIIGRNYPWFHEQGLDGHTSQGFDDWGAMGLTAWVAMRLYWDVTQDYRDLVAEYCRFRFGSAAAGSMEEYYAVFEKRMAEVPDICSNEIWGNHIAIDAATRDAAREKLDQARKLVSGDRETRHVQTVVDFQRAMDLWCDGIEHARETGDFAAAAKQMEPAFEIAAELNKLYSHFVNPKRIDRTTQTQFRPGGWYSKYLTWAEKIDKSSASLCLPRYWKIALDTDNTAWTRGWHKPDVSVDSLDEWDTTVVPDVKYQTQRETSAFFYRTDVAVPESFARKERIALYFPSIIARGIRIWVNGEPVPFDHGDYKDVNWRGPITFWYNYDHQQTFDVSNLVKPGKVNTIAVRVFKSFDHAGTYDRVFLLADPPIK